MLVGKQFGRYEIRQKLGAGGMGEVYLARDEQLDRQVALKILSAEFSSDPVRQNRFRQEAKAASALNHPNIITIHEIGESEHGAFLATEFIKGETLRETIKRSPLPLFRAVKIAEQVAAALGAAHEAHIVHRDIKPENIMIRGDGYVKVLDFGLAKLTAQGALENAESDLNSNNTLPGVVMGSVRYMSPEQARGQQIDERTDIWSLGAVFYEMLTGHAPFDGATPSDTLAAVIYKAPEHVSHFVPNAPAELQRIVRRALQKDRDERYQNIKDFALDLKNLLYEIEHEISLENKTQPLPAYLGNTVESERIHRTSGANQPTHITSVPTTSAEYIVEQVRRHKWQTAVFSFGLIAVLAAISLGYFRWNGQKPVATVKAFEKTQISRLTTDGKVRLPAISSDGKYVAYLSGEMGSRSLVVRQVATDSLVTIVPPTAQEFRGINFSPDGNYIYYVQLTRDYSIGTLYQVPTLGGTPKKLIEDIDSGVTFAPDGKRLAFLRHNPTEAS
ncbi:MAG TPA: protein kinase, partial [Pyrinomonadaceae bacterium]|nr:protein kinase [Pyrinomonadaceae bacterium]